MKREFAEGNIKERPMGNGKKHLDAIEALGMGRQHVVRGLEDMREWVGAKAAVIGLYRLVASATLPPANQVRDKHKDD